MSDERSVEVERMWRCTQCGKWSHAKNRPNGHQRRNPAYDPWMSEAVQGPELLPCGPFEEWNATPLRLDTSDVRWFEVSV